MVAVSSHYDQRYFEYQRSGGKFGGKAELVKFRDFIRPTDAVVDFGCGGGFLLSELVCGSRVGVEINPTAQEHGRQLGLSVVGDLSGIEDGWADVVISNHALEHTLYPYHQLLEVYRVLKHDGLAVFVVPCERHDTLFAESDVNQHLYTWSPMNLGNLFAAAGFGIVHCREFVHRWPPEREVIVRCFGWAAFHRVARLYGRIFRRCSQVRVVARKP